uniref:ATPase family AAA domain-containing protein n=1 Tax=Ovatospora sp. TaxID=2911399 RepID=A0AA97B5G8_9PEZI|nr:ATPase family AAA domain-containing protein [Ovatospora sp.]
MGDDPVASVEALSINDDVPPEDTTADDPANFPGDAIDSLHDNELATIGEDEDAGDQESGKAEEEEETWETRRQKTPLEVTVTWHNFEHFKNRYSPTDGMAIIEVLRGHHQIANEVTREAMQRLRVRARREPGPTASPADPEDCWIQRIRIQSPQLICLLSRLTGHRDGWGTDRPRVFYQPFRMFYYYLPQMRECLKILEEKWASHQPLSAEELPSQPKPRTKRATSRVPEGEAEESSFSDSSDSDSDDDLPEETGPMAPSVAIAGDLVDSPVTLSHVRKYVEFVEEHIVPKWEHAAGTTKRKVRFNELWMSFKPGELLYMPPATDSDENSAIGKQHSTKKQMYQNAWRIFSIVLSSVKDDSPDDTTKTSKRCLDLHSYYLDYDGTSYVPVRHMFCIKDYEDEKDITSFEVYPMRFVKDSEKIVKDLSREGDWFRQAIEIRHLYYDGWTLPYGPTADNSSSSSKDTPKPPPVQIEHVDGDVIIDFVEGFKSEPALGPGPSSWSQGLRDFNDSDWPMGDDDMAIRHWERGSNGLLKMVGEIREKSQRGEWFCEKMRNDHLNSKPLLKAHKEGNIVTQVDEEDLVLLPRRVVAYTFRERKFVMLDIRSLKKLPTSQSVFQDLKIDEQHKRMVKSLVKSHLKKQAAQKMRPTVNLDQDLFRGKGSGLFILLHGVPGVGKTATAEAVAQASKKPLFPITCGDLGFSPKDVETALKEIFRLAHHWGCVLLLDEADIFLSRRELGDLKRNALVSVFLRVLEYYSGILFLTTNRVGTLDEAFKSRIHVSLYYPPLSLKQTLAVFEVNIRKLRDIEAEHESVTADGESEGHPKPKLFIDEESILDYAEWHYRVHKKSPEQRWNGRQIRNAFQIAYSLAHFDMHKTSLDQWDEDDAQDNHPNTEAEKGLPPTELWLDYLQFEMVADAIEKFEEYLYRATGTTDKDKAATKHTRADDFDPYRWERKHNYREQQPPRAFHRPTYVPSNRGSQQPRQRAEYQPPPRRGDQQAPARRADNRDPPPSRASQQQQSTPASAQRRLLEVPSNTATPSRAGGSGSGSGRTGSPQSPSRASPSQGRSNPRYTPNSSTPRTVVNKPTPPSRRNDSGYSGWSTSPRTPGGRPELLENNDEEDEEGGRFSLDEEAVEGDERYHEDEEEFEEDEGGRYYRAERGEMLEEDEEEDEEAGRGYFERRGVERERVERERVREGRAVRYR